MILKAIERSQMQLRICNRVHIVSRRYASSAYADSGGVCGRLQLTFGGDSRHIETQCMYCVEKSDWSIYKVDSSVGKESWKSLFGGCRGWVKGEEMRRCCCR